MPHLKNVLIFMSYYYQGGAKEAPFSSSVNGIKWLQSSPDWWERCDYQTHQTRPHRMN